MRGHLSEPVSLDGWSVTLCPSCGTQVGEWLTEDGPDVVTYEQCPMCDEADEEDGWWL